MKFISSLTEPGQPYSCTQWQNGGVNGMPLVLDENQSSTGFFSLFHDCLSLLRVRRSPERPRLALWFPSCIGSREVLAESINALHEAHQDAATQEK